MRINTGLARDVMLNRDGINHLEVELMPPEAEEKDQAKPVLLVFVMDRSGSMGVGINRTHQNRFDDNVIQSSKMNYAKRALTDFLSFLTEKDLVGVVSFDDVAVVNQPLTHLTSGTKSTIVSNVQRIQPRGRTNISDALLVAKRMVSERYKEQYTRKIVLLSDGMANRGVSDVDGLSSLALGCLNEEVTVSCLGIGDDYDSGIMGAIADSGGGLFYHIQDLGQLEPIFREELDMSNRVTAKKVRLCVEIPELIEISENLNFYPQTVVDGSIIVNIGDLYGPRKVYFELRNNFTEEDFEINIHTVYLTVENEESEVKTSVTCKVVTSVGELTDAREDRAIINSVLNQIKERGISRASEVRDRDDFVRLDSVIESFQKDLLIIGKLYITANADRVLNELMDLMKLYKSRNTSKSFIKERYAESHRSAKGIPSNVRRHEGMGNRQDVLEWLLKEAGGMVTQGTLPFPRHRDIINSIYFDEVVKVYQELGGILDDFPLNLRSWDIEVDGIAVELDEQLHFNRYRAITLRSPVYKGIEGFPLDKYIQYCTKYEKDCLRAGSYGGKWTNPSCERQFGPAGQGGDLSGSGAPRWKQRAFYDYVKDLSSLVIGVPVVRVSIWEEFNLRGTVETFGGLIDSRDRSVADRMLLFIKSRGEVKSGLNVHLH